MGDALADENWLVHFFMHSDPNSEYIKEIFALAAAAEKDDRNMVNFGQVDCDLEINFPICKRFVITLTRKMRLREDDPWRTFTIYNVPSFTFFSNGFAVDKLSLEMNQSSSD